MDIGLISRYLGIKIKQGEYGIFINQKKFAREVLKKFKMEDFEKVSTFIERGVKMSKNNEGKKINSTTLKNLVESLRYLTCTHPYILLGVGLMNKFIETSSITHFKVLNRVLQNINCIVDSVLLYGYYNSFELIGYNDIG